MDASTANDLEQPLKLILARNLVSIVSLAALLVDPDGRIVFFNDAAAEIVGSSLTAARRSATGSARTEDASAICPTTSLRWDKTSVVQRPDGSRGTGSRGAPRF